MDYWARYPGDTCESSDPEFGAWKVVTRFQLIASNPVGELANRDIHKSEKTYVHSVSGEVVKTSPKKHTSFSASGENDICSYCGADNGIGGEFRQGWDCCCCGGN